jgi:hypothetical protein
MRASILRITATSLALIVFLSAAAQGAMAVLCLSGHCPLCPAEQHASTASNVTAPPCCRHKSTSRIALTAPAKTPPCCLAQPESPFNRGDRRAAPALGRLLLAVLPTPIAAASVAAANSISFHSYSGLAPPDPEPLLHQPRAPPFARA